jgi:DNA-binding CsgD family transcriptional regulator
MELTSFLKKTESQNNGSFREQICEPNFEISESVLSFTSCFNTPITIFNQELKRFIFVNKAFLNLLGMSEEELCNSKQENYGLWVDDNDNHVLNEGINDAFKECCDKIAKHDIGKLSYMINFRLKKKDHNGEQLQMLVQRNVLEWNEDRTPKITLDLYSDIGRRKHSNKILLTVKHLNTISKKWDEVLEQEFLRVPQMLASREKEILKLMLDDKSSTQISIEKEISVYTVRSHWRNILLKTNCESKSQLKRLAFAEGWI